MLPEVKELQNRVVSELFGKVCERQKEITFKAPTGSGKTFMMADFINRVLENPTPLLKYTSAEDIIFLVSSLSTAGLAAQNYEKFLEYTGKHLFPHIDPFLINSEITPEERLFIPTGHNVYFLPRDLYHKNTRLMQGPMESFLQNITKEKWLNGQNKLLIVIKDESHIETKNLDALSTYFHKIINFSATPKEKPDVEMREDEAVNTGLIKNAKENWEDKLTPFTEVLDKYEEVKQQYAQLLNMTPCMIVQISNTVKGNEELTNIKREVSKRNLGWMYIVQDDKKCETNDKCKDLPVAKKWSQYAKESPNINVIIFKMKIKEGWDIPRACMLYQIRKSESDQMDEQVVGRVRRNPCLLNFENLSPEAQKLATTAWVWGVKTKEADKVIKVKMKEEAASCRFMVKTTSLKPISAKNDFNLQKFLENKKEPIVPSSIFELGRKVHNAIPEIKKMIYNYADNCTKWFSAAENITDIAKEYSSFQYNYADSMKLAEEVPFQLLSYYTEQETQERVGNWIWRKTNKNDDKFHFDSKAEGDFAVLLTKLARSAFQKAVVPNDLSNEQETYLWGKNFLPHSSIKFEYYLNGHHFSYPDFIMKDTKGKIHLFEVKSVNKNPNQTFNPEEYENKIRELKKAYQQASKLTGQNFYLPIQNNNDEWYILWYKDGEEQTPLNEQELEQLIRGK